MGGKLGRTVAIAVLLFLLVLSVGTANLAVGLDRTALNEEFVADTLAEEDAYAVLLEEAQSQIESESAATTGAGPSPGELLPKVVTESYLRNQTEANLDRTYAYLEGEREDLYLAINTTPLKDDLAAELASQLMDEFTLADVEPDLARMTESESEFQAVREEFRAEQLAQIQEGTSVELTQAQLEDAYDDRRDQIREEAVAEFERQVATSDQPEALQSAIVDLGTVHLEALVAADPSYEQFTTDVEAARADLESAVEAVARDQIDEELPDTMVLSEQLTQENRQQLERLRSLVSVLSLLVFFLPLLALGAALLVVRLSSTRSTGLLFVGSAIAVVGLVEALGFAGVGGRAETEISAIATRGDMSAGLADLLAAILTRTISVFVTQSWVIVGIGVLLLVVGIAIRRGLLPIGNGSDGSMESVRTDSNAGGANTRSVAEDRTAVDVSSESEDVERENPVGDVDPSEDES